MAEEKSSGFSEKMKQDRLVFYEEDIEPINEILSDCLDASQAKCALLIDKEGHLVTKKGFTKSIDTTSLAALIAGSFASTRQMAKMLGESEFSVLFHQGKNENIHLSLISERAILVIIFDDRTTIGMVRLYANEISSKIDKVLQEAAERQKDRPQDEISEKFKDEAEKKLDSFFDEN